MTDNQSKTKISKSSLQILQDQLSRTNQPSVSRDSFDKQTSSNKHSLSRVNQSGEEEQFPKEQLSSSQSFDCEYEDFLKSQKHLMGNKPGFQIQAGNSIIAKSVANSEETAYESMSRISQAETLKNIALKAKQKYEQMQTKPPILEEKD